MSFQTLAGSCLAFAALIGGASGPGPRSGVASAATSSGEEYFPSEVGDSWAYVIRTTGRSSLPDVYGTVIQVTQKTGVPGDETIVFRESNVSGSGSSGETTRSRTAKRIRFLASNGAYDPLDSRIGAYDEVRFPARPGRRFVAMRDRAVGLGEDLDGDGRNEIARVTVSVVLRRAKSVSTEAGAFASCLRQDLYLDFVVTGSRTGKTVRVPARQTHWFAPGVGRVKTRTTVPIDARRRSRTTESLRGYSVGALSGGIVSNVPLVTEDRDIPLYPAQRAFVPQPDGWLVVGSREIGPQRDEFVRIPVSHSGLASPESSGPALGPSDFTHAGAAAGDGVVLLAFARSGALHIARFDALGAPLDGADGIEVSTGTSNFLPDVSFRGGTFLVVWSKHTNQYDIWGALVGPSGTPGPEFPILETPNEDVFGRVSEDDSGWFVVARHALQSGEYRVFGSHVAADGRVAGTGGVELMGGAEPAVSFGDGTHLVVSLGTTAAAPGVRCVRAGLDGAVVDGGPDGVLVEDSTSGVGSVSVAHGPSGFLVAWVSGQEIHARRIASVGPLASAVAASEILTLSDPSVRPVGTPSGGVDVAASGSAFLVVWMTRGLHDNTTDAALVAPGP